MSLGPAGKKAVKVTADKVAVVKFDLANRGGTPSGHLKVCAKLGKQAKKGLRAPKCVAVRLVPAGETVVVKLRVKTKKAAKGVYGFMVEVKGATVNSATAKVRVVEAKRKARKEHEK